MRKVFIIVIALILVSASQIFSQEKKHNYGVGVSIGLLNKAQFYLHISNKSKISLDVGTMLIGDDFDLGMLGIMYKYSFNETEFTPYIGMAASLLSVNDEDYYFHVPLGLQKSISENLIVFGGYNPGLLISRSNYVIFSAELGIEYLF